MSATNRGAQRQPNIALRPISGVFKYLAGSDGHIYSMAVNRKQFKRMAEGRDKDGYCTTQLRHPDGTGKSKKYRVHRLVAVAFHGVSGLPEVRHLNGDKEDNRPSNLRWGTQLDNAHDRDRHGRTVRGDLSPNAKLRAPDVLYIRNRVAAGATLASLAAELGVCIATVGHVTTGRNWGHLP
jgi:hypothetical protein